jgi:para-nitrobenzyl esterase
MVFIYGGHSAYGGAGFPLYDGEADVALAQDVILVTLNYRLNAFGFLAGDLLKAESSDGSVGNYGFQDQVAGLAFVARNAGAFGGNPGRVTIFGESSGAASVSVHLVSPASAGLFAGAIIESGAFSGWTAQPYSISRTRLSQLAGNLDCTSGDVLGCMRAVNATTLMAAQYGLTSGQADLTWGSTIDGVVLTDDPRVLVAAGHVANVPVMLGFNHDEATLFNTAPTSINASGYLEALQLVLGPAIAADAVAEYPVADYEDTWWTICAVLRDSSMLCPGRDTAGWLTAPTRTPPQSVHVYYYTQVRGSR